MSEDLVINHLGQFISEHRREAIEAILAHRTRHITLVLEDVFQSQNASAVFRTAECFGVQDIHLIENLNRYSINKKVLRGAHKWLSIFHYNQPGHDNTATCIKKLKEDGYKILATSPAATTSITDIPVSQKTAVILGNELHGLSETAHQCADLNVKIPMYGFTESLNLSASAAICLNTLIPRMRGASQNWELSDSERTELRLLWYRKVVKRSELIEKNFLKSIE